MLLESISTRLAAGSSASLETSALCSLAAAFATPPPSWSCLPSPPLTVCAWSGVTCTNASVTAIDLSNVTLGGSLSPALSDLTSLTSLNLAWTGLTGDIPHSICSMTQLTALVLCSTASTSDSTGCASLGRVPLCVWDAPHTLSKGVPAALHLLSTKRIGALVAQQAMDLCTLAQLVHHLYTYLSHYYPALTPPFTVHLSNMPILQIIPEPDGYLCNVGTPSLPQRYKVCSERLLGTAIQCNPRGDIDTLNMGTQSFNGTVSTIIGQFNQLTLLVGSTNFLHGTQCIH